MADKVTVNVYPGTRNRLIRLRGRLESKTGKRMSLNDVISGLLDLEERGRRSK